MIGLRKVTGADWERLRDIRLAALADAPEAFSSTYAREVGFTGDDWRAWARTSACFFASEGGEDLGLAGGLPRPDEWLLVSLWVAPAARGRGVGTALVNVVAKAAAEAGVLVLALQVQEHNAVARRLYEGLGFTATGEWERTGSTRRERMNRITPVSTVE